MHPETGPTTSRLSTSRAVRHHLVVVILGVALGALAGVMYAGSMATTYTSTARVLINPTVGNPYVPAPASVRQDELTSLETEAQVARSQEVLEPVADLTPGLSIRQVSRALQVVVPANTQILEISFSSTDRALAQLVTDAVAQSYLTNRARRSAEVSEARIERVEAQTASVVTDLRAANAAAQLGDRAERLFQTELSGALRNGLVSLRAQRTALDNAEASPGTLITPASSPAGAGELVSVAVPVGGALAGLALGCVIALLLERFAGVVRSAAEVEATGLPVIAAVASSGPLLRLLRRDGAEAIATTIRRLRATILDLAPRPDVIAVAPAGRGPSDAGAAEAVATSFARAGHRVVLVRTDRGPRTGGVEVEEQGLSQALLHERLNVLDLLQSSADPLLSVLPDGGFTTQSRELLIADRVRTVLAPLIDTGHLVVLQSPGIDSAEGEAVVGAADLGLVVVTRGRTRPGEVDQVNRQTRTRGAVLVALVVGASGLTVRARRSGGTHDADRTVVGASIDELTPVAR